MGEPPERASHRAHRRRDWRSARLIPFAADRSHGLFWDSTDATLNVAETNFGHVYRFEPRSGELLAEWQIEGPEVHGFTRSEDGRIWVGDASTNNVLIVAR